MSSTDDRFTVVAGKYEGHSEENIKYIDDFATLDEALTAYDKVSGYHFARIEYKGRHFSP